MSHAESEMTSGERLSSLVDGELALPEVDRACRSWRDDVQHREQWHAYHLIGDVLRSEDLAASTGHEIPFLAALRERLASEPVVLAPAPLLRGEPHLPQESAAQRKRRPAWRHQAAMVAGFAAVAGVLWVTQWPAAEVAPSSPVAQSEVAPLDPLRVDRPEVTPVTLDAQLIRDARLDEYLAAHKKLGGSSTAGAPSRALRHAVDAGR